MKALPLAVAAVLLMVMVPVLPMTTADAGDGKLLIDMGNGTTYWCDISAQGSYASVAQDCAGKLGLSVSVSGSGITAVGGLAEHSVGDQTCRWNLYVWDAGNGAWMPGEAMGAQYDGGAFAIGFYPDGSITPAETPDEPTAWISAGGDSSSSSVSDSYGTVGALVPPEWYKTYSTGFVDSEIVVAGGLLYHTTGGSYGAAGSDRDPWVYCLDRYTGELVWEFHYAYGQGYEVTTPLIVGDTLVITATNGDVYCLDRYDGTLLDTLKLEMSYPVDGNGDIIWNGRTFLTGGTTPVYDSGAIYFGTSDGRVLCYSLTPEKKFSLLWDYDPPATGSKGDYSGTRGCFYYHPPVIADVDGMRMLFIGSYGGNVHALDASTGKEIWVQKVIDLRDENKPHPGTPGSAGSIAVTREGKLIVCCSDGGLSSLTGYVISIDAATGKGADGSEYDWKLDVLCNHPVAVEDGFYAYISPLSSGSSKLRGADGTGSDAVSAIYKFDLQGRVVWTSQAYQMIKASLTLADGVLYAMDYSAGTFYPTGGAVMAIDAEDGSEIWRLQLTPFSADSYSMVSPTVIDGKIYVGNDYGAVYCISEVAGKIYGDSGEIVLENGLYHWSWLALLVFVIACFLFLRKYY